MGHNLPKFCAASLVTLLCAAPACAVARAQPVPQARFEALPLELSRQNHLLVRAFINGKAALLGVDTGAPVSAISAARRAHFGLTGIPRHSKIPQRLVINGSFNRVGIVHDLRLGGLHLIDEPLVAIDFGRSTRATRELAEPELDGILGADILFPTEAVVDCARQMLILKVTPDISGGPPGLDRAGWSSVPINVTRGYNLYVESHVNGRVSKMMVDTGAFTTLLHRPFLARMKIPLRETPYTSGGVNLRERGVQLATLKKFSVGSFEIRGKEVGVMDLQGLIHGNLLEGSPPVAGLLGSEFLRRNHGIIDFGTRMLYLKL
jgi:predicted aspartyl protease